MIKENYTLFHKNIPVLKFMMAEDEIIEICEIINKEHLPVGMFREYELGASLRKQFSSWWKSRAIPISRQKLRDALELLGGITTEELVTKSFGLSLSDHYWAKPDLSEIAWEKINFFENDFSEDVGKALFGTLEEKDISSLSLISPDNTSDGWLKKKWIIDGGKRILIKGGSGESQQEPFNEVLATEICKRLNIACVDYVIVEQDGKHYSGCECFVNTETEFVSAAHIKGVLKKQNSISEYEHLLKCCEILGMKVSQIERELCNMICVDYAIANSDRHFNNFGFIRNANTLEWLGLAPVFDSGTSLFHDVSLYDLKRGVANVPYKVRSKPFAKTHAEQIKKLPCKNYCADLAFENLKGIKDYALGLFGKNQHIGEKKKMLANILNERTTSLIKFIVG